MNSEELQNTINSINEKVGENSGVIADDLARIITLNNTALETISSQSSEIETLRDRNEKLIVANGNLLQQVPMGKEKPPVTQSENAPVKSTSLKDCFDSKGNFKKSI